jgi:adenylyltransferase/sulfurtransferase
MCSTEHNDAAQALTPTALDAIRAHAAAAYPDECCGLVFDDGVHRCTNVQDALHAADPDGFPRTARRAFRLADAEQLLLARSFDGPRPARVLYHSHVDADAYLSAADVAGATLDGRPLYPELLHLVVAVRDGVPGDAVLFVLDGDGPRERARFTVGAPRQGRGPGPGAPPTP